MKGRSLKSLQASAIRLRRGGLLAIGGSPPTGPWLGMHFDLLVLAAKEVQPPSWKFPGLRVIHVPLADGLHELPMEQHLAVLAASREVAKTLAAGKSVLVTCQAGLNRSALIATLALMRLGYSPNKATALVRRLRTGALNNPRFVATVRAAQGKLTRVR